MSQLISNQEALILQTQELYNQLLQGEQYAEAIAVGKLLADLASAYKDLGCLATSPVIQKLPSTFGNGFGQATFNQPTTQTFFKAKLPQPQHYKPQPSRYAWADGFTGVEVPRRQESEPLPNPDYWQDE